MAGIKIVDLPPLGRDLASTDLLELSLAGGTGSRKITGQEIMNASKLSINNTPIINGTVGRVLFQGTGNVLQQSSSLFWDATNNRLGIGTSSPAYTIDSIGTIKMSALFGKGIGTSDRYFTFDLEKPTGTIPSIVFGAYDDNATRYLSFGGEAGSTKYATQYLYFFTGATNTTVAGTRAMAILPSGNINIGSSITDAGFRLDVNGTFRALVSTETNPFVVQHTNGNSATIIIGNGSQLAAGQMGMYFNSSPIWTWNGSAFRLPGNIISTQNNPSTLLISGGWGGSTVGTSLRLSSNTGNQGVFTATSGTQSTVEIGNTSNETWSPSSGNATYNLLSVVPRINTTGTYSGIVRGIIYAPTLTSVTGVDHRAIETTTGNVLFGTTSGNVGIGTSSPAQKLDVNGTARFKDTGSNSSVIIDYATGGYIRVNDASLGEAIRLRAGGGASWFNTGQNLLIGTTTDAGFRLDVNGTGRFTGNVTLDQLISNQVRSSFYNTATNSFTVFRAYTATGNAAFYQNVSVGTTSEPVASAVLQADSTTKGFLPPRMTQAERNAIASPAIGLEIYQTDATEGKYIYKSFGWTYIG